MKSINLSFEIKMKIIVDKSEVRVSTSILRREKRREKREFEIILTPREKLCKGKKGYTWILFVPLPVNGFSTAQIHKEPTASPPEVD